jgi:serine/threonine protein phosphatase PrpC
VVAEQQLREVLGTTSTPQQAVDRFAELVEEAGAPDNFAYVVVDALARS